MAAQRAIDGVAAARSGGRGTRAAVTAEELTIKRVLRDAGVVLRSPAEQARRYTLDLDTFADPLTSADRYWIGMLLADGCVYGNSVILQLHRADVEHVRAFLRYCGSNAPVTFPRDAARGTVCAREVAERPGRFGVTERKSDTARLDRGLEASAAAWLGLLDGDGSVYLPATGGDAPALTWTGTRQLMVQCRTWLGTVLGTTPSREPSPATCSGASRSPGAQHATSRAS